MMIEEPDSDTVTEVLPDKRQRPLRGLYLDHGLAKLWAQKQQALVVTTFLADANGVIAKSEHDKHFEVPRETRNASDWRLSQELMSQADVLICGGAYLKRVSAPGSQAQDILSQFEAGGAFEDLGTWRLRTRYPKRSPDLAIISRHLDFDVPEQARIEGRRITIFTTDGMAESDDAARFAAEGMPVIGGGEVGVRAGRMIDYLQDETGAHVIVMASGPRVLELLLHAGRLDLLYLTRVQREIPFDDPSTVITLLPSGKKAQDLEEFHLTHQYYQDHAIAGDGLPVPQFFLRYDRTGEEG